MGAMSGKSWITTRPCFRSRYSVFSGSRAGFESLMVPVSCSLLFDVRGDAHVDDAIRLARNHPARAAAALDLIDVLHAARDLAPDRVFALPGRCRGEHAEELEVGAV